MHKRDYDLLGQRFGRLEVCSLESKGKYTKWKCRCDCGNDIVVGTSSLIRTDDKKARSCGCLWREKITKPVGVSVFHSFMYDYKSNAKRKNRDFLLSEEEFRDIISQDCFYCGSSPAQLSRQRKAYKINGTICANGIDRIDSEKGYVKDNCVPCCTYCNWMKSDKTRQEFLSHIQKICLYSQSSS